MIFYDLIYNVVKMSAPQQVQRPGLRFHLMENKRPMLKSSWAPCGGDGATLNAPQWHLVDTPSHSWSL